MEQSTLNWRLPTIIIATASAALLLYALYNKNKEQKEKETRKASQQQQIEPNDIDEKANASSLPLPGQCSIKQTFILSKDLDTLKTEYSKYEQLIPRSLNIINQDLYNRKDGFSVMQFNMLADGLSGAYSAIQTDKTFLGVDKVYNHICKCTSIRTNICSFDYSEMFGMDVSRTENMRRNHSIQSGHCVRSRMRSIGVDSRISEAIWVLVIFSNCA